MLKNLKARHAAYTFLSTVLLLIALLVNVGSAAAAGTAVQVAVNVKSSLGTIPNTAFGLNTAAWDAHLLDPAVARLLRQANINVLRFPGGSTADFYHWKTNTVTSTEYGSINPKDTFDAFMGVVNKVGAQPMLTVNYGSNAAGTAGGDPNEAAAWVKYANITRHYGVQYWEIGNEVYGNGTYGSKWEVDLHKDLGPAAYAKNALTFIKAMKKVDPKIKVGLVLTAPGNWPDGSNPDWNSAVLSNACQQMDFATVHWYPQGPGGESDTGLLGSTNQISQMVDALHAKINKYCGKHAKDVKITITETNSVSFNPGKQTVGTVNGLFLADNYLSWLEKGVVNVDWWGLHNGMSTGQNNSSSLMGDAEYGDYGILSSGSAAQGMKEPPANTPFASYYALQALTRLASPGDQMLKVSSGEPQVTVHAVKKKDGTISVLLINKDTQTAHPVNLSLQGLAKGNQQFRATIFSPGRNGDSFSATTRASVKLPFSQTVSPYSMALIVLTPKK